MNSPRIIAVTNQKGGVGKTTTTVNLAASLALADRKTLVIDFDPQGNASSALGWSRAEHPESSTIYEALIGEKPISECIAKTEIDGLDLVPATNDLAGAEIELVSAFSRENKLKLALSQLPNKYDFVFIDSPPSLGLLTINSLTAANGFIVPLQTEYFALEGLSQLLQTVSLIKMNLNPQLENEGVVLTMFDGRNKLAHEVEREVRQHLDTLVFQTVIPRNVRLSECSSFGKPVVLYDVDSKGCIAYLNLAREFLERAQKHLGGKISSKSQVSPNIDAGMN